MRTRKRTHTHAQTQYIKISRKTNYIELQLICYFKKSLISIRFRELRK